MKRMNHILMIVIGNVLEHYVHIIFPSVLPSLAFAAATLLSTFLFPAQLEFFESTAVFHHYLDNPLIACVPGGILIGTGMGLVLKADASTSY